MNTPNELDEHGAMLSTSTPEIDQRYADQGRGFAQLRMARRYREGDGVEKNLTKARLYFIKAVAAGLPGARDELAKLS